MFGDRPLVVVESKEAFDKMLAQLRHAPVIGVDTESDSSHSYQEKVCLIQISDLHTDFIVDTLTVDVSDLGELLADEQVVKVLHGADYDLVCLFRDYGFEINNLFDTLIAAQMLCLERVGLADLLARYFGLDIDKKFQRHDWSQRPLGEEHLDYARGDTHYLLALRELMSWELEPTGRIEHFQEECEFLRAKNRPAAENKELAFYKTKGATHLDSGGYKLLQHLHKYRDREAEALNRPVFKVIPNRVLVQICQDKPSTESKLDRIIGRNSGLKRRFGRGILKTITEALADDSPVPSKPVKAKVVHPWKPRLRGKSVDRLFVELKNWRNEASTRPGRNAYTVASNGTLKAIATYCPKDQEELRALDNVRNWQARDFGDELLEIVSTFLKKNT